MDGGFLKVGYLESILNAMSDMVRVITREGKVALTNVAYDRKIALGKKTVGSRCYEAFCQEGECDFCISRDVMATGSTQQTIRKNGNRVYSVTASPLTDDKGEVIAAVEVFRDMTLDYNIKQNLLTQNAKMQRDLQMARSLQQALVRNVLPSIDGYKLHSGFFPCEAVGGDIYDCLSYGDKLVMYVADVSGHGVMPAMLAVFFSRAVRAACSLGKMAPSEIFAHVQKEYLELDLADSIYITGFIAVLDTKKDHVTFSNAGLSVAPILFDGSISELYMSAPPICSWFDKPEYKDDTVSMKPGARMLIYSDGIYNIHSDNLVRERLYDMFGADDFSSDGFVGCVRRELHTHPEDDLTLLLCQKI